MLKDLAGKIFLDGNYNCAEAVTRAANEYYGFGLHDNDMRMVAAFGGGIQCGSVCGAVLGAAAVLSMKYVETKSHDSTDIKPVTNMLIEKVKDRYNSILCTDIKPQSYVEGLRCQRTVDAVCDLLEETIVEYEAGK